MPLSTSCLGRLGLALCVTVTVAIAAAGAQAQYWYQAVYLSDNCAAESESYTSAYLFDYCFRQEGSSSYFQGNSTHIASYNCRSSDCSANCSSNSVLPIMACYSNDAGVSYTWAVEDTPPPPTQDAFVQTTFNDSTCSSTDGTVTSLGIYINGCLASNFSSGKQSYLTGCNDTHCFMSDCTDAACSNCTQTWVEAIGCSHGSFNTSTQTTHFVPPPPTPAPTETPTPNPPTSTPTPNSPTSTPTQTPTPTTRSAASGHSAPMPTMAHALVLTSLLAAVAFLTAG